MKKKDWIKVEDKLPQNESTVLVYDQRQGVIIADYDEYLGFSNYEHGLLDYVTHWVELEMPEK